MKPLEGYRNAMLAIKTDTDIDVDRIRETPN